MVPVDWTLPTKGVLKGLQEGSVCVGTLCGELTPAYHLPEMASFTCQVEAGLLNSVCSWLSSLFQALYFSECFPPFPGDASTLFWSHIVHTNFSLFSQGDPLLLLNVKQRTSLKGYECCTKIHSDGQRGCSL